MMCGSRAPDPADCFIVLDAERGSVAPGDLVAAQVFEGLV
jgi:hypothetical protein